MITVAQALDFIQKQALSRPIIQKPLLEALHYTLAQDVFSPIDWPTHPQSAMDGYGISLSNYTAGASFSIKQVVAAGDFVEAVSLGSKEAIRIFTGAFVPKGVDAIIQQEHIVWKEGAAYFPETIPPVGQHIRPKASQTQQGDLVAAVGDGLNPARCALLRGLGLSTVMVFEKPRVQIVCTGNELVLAGEELMPGKIYESNSTALLLALQERGISSVRVSHCSDNKEDIKHELQAAMNTADVVLVTGGVSVGDYDFVVPALTELGVETIFHGVKQKPGKPFYFGKQNQCAVFGLPGNPASVLTCFYMYTLPYLDACEQKRQASTISCFMALSTAYAKKAGLTHFVKARVGQGELTLLDNQESYKMNGFAEANALVEVDETTENLPEGSWVKVYLL
jgi:molybdopterin molybdotransferase